MINPFKDVNWNPDAGELRKFGWTVFLGFIIIASVLVILQSVGIRRITISQKIPLYVSCAGIAVLLASYAVRPLAVQLYRVWFFLSCCIGIVMSNLILVIFFYFFFTPIAVILRGVTGRDPLLLKRSSTLRTYWQSIPGRRPLESYLKQY